MLEAVSSRVHVIVRLAWLVLEDEKLTACKAAVEAVASPEPLILSVA